MGLAAFRRWLHSPAAWPVVSGVLMAIGWGASFAVFAAPSVQAKLNAFGASLTLALIGLSNVLAISTGGSTVVMFLFVVLSAVGTGLSALPLYAAFAANGGSYVGDGAAKAATLVAVTAAIGALCAVARSRLKGPAGALVFLLVVISSIFIFEGYWYATPVGVLIAVPKTPLQLAPESLVVATCVPFAILVVLVWLVLPIPAGRQARAVFCAVLHDLGAFSDAIVDLATGEEEDSAAAKEEGHLEEGGKLGAGASGWGLLLIEEAFTINYRIRDGLLKLQGLFIQAKLELDLYARQKVFPGKRGAELGAVRELQAYALAAADASGATVSLAILLRQLSTGIAPAGFCGLEIPEPPPTDRALLRQAAPQLQAAQSALRGCLTALVAVVEEGMPLPDALRQLSTLEECWRGVWDGVAEAEGGQPAVIALRFGVGLLFSAASKVRSAFGHVASAVEGLQPGAEAAVAAHLEASSWDSYLPGIIAKQLAGDFVAPALMGSMEPAAAEDGADDGAKPGEGAAEPPMACGGLRRALDAAGLGRAQLAPGLQMLIILAVAYTLIVVKSAYVALGTKSSWVMYSVVALAEPTVGRVFLKSRNRLVGTAMGAAWGYCCIAVAYAANGNSYANTTVKYVVIAVMASAWGGAMTLCRMRYGPDLDYLWQVSNLTIVVVVIEALLDPNPPWTAAGWRLASVCIGMCIDVLVTTLVFPVTSNVLMRQELGTACADLAALAEGTAEGALCGISTGDGEGADVEAGDGPTPTWTEDEAAASQKRLVALGNAVQASLVTMKGLRDSEAREQSWSCGLYTLATGRAAAQLEGEDEAMAVVMRLRDALFGVGFHVDVLPWARRLAASVPPARRRLVLAAGARAAASLRALQRVLRKELPMAAALRTLAPLDAVLGQLMAAQRAEAWPGRQRGEGRWAAVGLPTPGGDVNTVLTTFIAAMLGSSVMIRKLYYAAAVALLPGDEAAIAAAGAEVQRWRSGVLEAQAVASAALMEEACRPTLG